MNKYRAKENGQPGLGVMKIRNRCQRVVTAIGMDVAKRLQVIVLSGLLVLGASGLAQSSEWVPIIGAEPLPGDWDLDETAQPSLLEFEDEFDDEVEELEEPEDENGVDYDEETEVIPDEDDSDDS